MDHMTDLVPGRPAPLQARLCGTRIISPTLLDHVVTRWNCEACVTAACVRGHEDERNVVAVALELLMNVGVVGDGLRRKHRSENTDQFPFLLSARAPRTFW